MKIAALIGYCCLAVICLGCASQSNIQSVQPALLKKVSPEVTAEIQVLVSEALGGVKVTLGSEVFVDKSILVVERNRQHMALIGRDMAKPIKFQLLTDGRKCWLARLSSDEMWELSVPCELAVDEDT
ncbi:hypothetical protein [Microbulbifer sp. DLAB2-AA]|uniref:hypothetical protein n=1 Tax=Microbulbifer sp. DLAB2-AA TaxID=3243394 RepID=UPI00403956EE